MNRSSHSPDAHLRYPETAGRWIPKKVHMLCRLPLKTLRVQAPLKFLRDLESQCDGRTKWSEVVDTLATRWPRDEVEACMAGLMNNGLLVEGTNALAAYSRVGWNPQALAADTVRLADTTAWLDASNQQLSNAVSTQEIHSPSATVLQRLLLERQSTRTFADRALSRQSLVNILWATYGTLANDNGRIKRAVPSGGGLYALRWFVALLRPTQGYDSGLYEVIYHATGSEGGAVSLHHLTGSATDAWTTLLTPTVLTYAHAVLYPIADLAVIGKKYGNRSLTLALIEAGHALQNSALAAQIEGAASVVRSDTVEMAVLSTFNLVDTYHPLPALVLGVKPSKQEMDSANAAVWSPMVRILPAHAVEASIDSHIAVAGPIRIGKGDSILEAWAAGRDENPRTATIKAEAEAWERVGWSSPGMMHIGPMREIDHPVDPRSIVAYSDEQYALFNFPFSPFSKRRSYPWTKATRARDGGDASIMAQCVYALSSFGKELSWQPFTNASTSGVAAFTDETSARARALIELIERDAFARTWLRRVAPNTIDESCLPEAARQRLTRLRDLQYNVSVHVLSSGYLPVICIFAQRRSAKFTSLTTGAGFTLEDAMLSALAEAESRIQNAHDKPPLADIRQIDVLLAEHHGDFYRTTKGYQQADWIRRSKKGALTLENIPRYPGTFEALLSRLFDGGLEAYFVDLTPKQASVQQGRMPLYVSRAFVPGLLPIWFGHGVEPLGLCADLHLPGGTVSVHPCT